jgi:hypothetical protein
VDPNFVYPYTQQANVTIEREVGRGQRVRASYILSREVQMAYRQQQNLPLPKTTAWSDDQYLVPNYRSINKTLNGGQATYHAGELVWYPNDVFGISGESGLTWRKQLTDVPESRFNSAAGYNTQEWSCRACDRAESGTIRKVVWHTYVHWQLPFGRGQQYASDLEGLANQLLGGWEISAEAEIGSGNRLTPHYTGTDPSGLNATSGRPDLVGAWKSWELGAAADNLRWFDHTPFAVPKPLIGRFGNAGKNIILGPSNISLNTGIFKTFPVGEIMDILFSSQITNPLNYANWAYAYNQAIPPINSTSPARLTGVRPGMRTIKFSLAFEF